MKDIKNGCAPIFHENANQKPKTRWCHLASNTKITVLAGKKGTCTHTWKKMEMTKQIIPYANSNNTTTGSSSSYLKSIFSGYKMLASSFPFEVAIPVQRIV